MYIPLHRKREDSVSAFGFSEPISPTFACRCAIRIFDSEESFFTFLKDNNLNTECARALEGLGRFNEAAEIYLSKRKIEQAISLFLQGKSWNRAGEHLLSRLWRRYGFDVPIDRDLGNKGLWEHLGKLLEYTNFLETNIKNEVRYFPSRCLKHVFKFCTALHV